MSTGLRERGMELTAVRCIPLVSSVSPQRVSEIQEPSENIPETDSCK